jgi:TPR repeat protein
MRARRALFVLGLSVAAVPAASAAESWVEVKTAHFTVLSNAGESRARQTALEFEQVRTAYARIWAWVPDADNQRGLVVALKDELTMKRWAPGYYEVKGGIDLAAVTVHGADRDYLLLRTDTRPADQDVTPNMTLYRTYLASLFAHAFERPLPLWLSNGMSEVFGNITVHDKEILAGRPVPWHLRKFTQDSRPSLRAVLDAKPGSALVTQDSERAAFDAYCWTLVHYLFFGERGANQAKIGRFTELWAAGKPQDQALAEAFGDVALIDKQLPAYATSKILSFAQFPAEIAIEREKLPARSVPPAELAGVLAAVHVGMDRSADAKAAIDESRKADPKAPGSYDAEGLLADREDKRDAAAQAYDQAIELGSTSAHTYYRAARLAWKNDADAATLAGVRKRLERALELNPYHSYGHSFLADVLVQQGEAQPALALVLRALKLEPAESYHYVTWARVLHALKRDPDARLAATRGLTLATNDSERANAQGFLDFLGRSAAYEQQHASTLAMREQEGACVAGDSAACAGVLPRMESQCADGEGQACGFAAWIYREGRGVPKDLARAVGFLERACAAGQRESCVQHAWSQARGEGIAKNEVKAMAALDGLCEEKFYAACTRLAVLYAAKQSVPSRARAKDYLAKGCEGGDPEACRIAKTLK